MIKKIDPRIPKEVGEGALPSHPSIKTPWGKLVGTQETLHYAARLHAVYSSLMFEAMRILVPDYDQRCDILCNASYKNGFAMYADPASQQGNAFFNIPPFMKGCMLCGVTGDYGDEMLMMSGRVNDCGSYRVEKEVDHCPWDIVGSELGRCTTSRLQAIGDGLNQWQNGPKLELNMIEAKCCGDLHCRIVAENREKYPLPGSESKRHMDCYGPVVTGDQIRFTPEENIVPDSQYFREECGYKYTSALVMQKTAGDAYIGPGCEIPYGMGLDYATEFFAACVEQGILTWEQVTNCLRWMFEGAGKAMFCDDFAVFGLRTWLGAPSEVNDGRLLGGYIEMSLQTLRVKYEIEEFNKEEVIYRIDRQTLCRGLTLLPDALVAYWHGMSKTMLSAMWNCVEEKADAPDSMLRIRILRRADKYGS